VISARNRGNEELALYTKSLKKASTTCTASNHVADGKCNGQARQWQALLDRYMHLFGCVTGLHDGR